MPFSHRLRFHYHILCIVRLRRRRQRWRCGVVVVVIFVVVSAPMSNSCSFSNLHFHQLTNYDHLLQNMLLLIANAIFTREYLRWKFCVNLHSERRLWCVGVYLWVLFVVKSKLWNATASIWRTWTFSIYWYFLRHLNIFARYYAGKLFTFVCFGIIYSGQRPVFSLNFNFPQSYQK